MKTIYSHKIFLEKITRMKSQSKHERESLRQEASVAHKSYMPKYYLRWKYLEHAIIRQKCLMSSIKKSSNVSELTTAKIVPFSSVSSLLKRENI